MAYSGRCVQAVTFRREEGPRWAPPSPLLHEPNVTAHPPTASVPTSHYSMWHSKGLNGHRWFRSRFRRRRQTRLRRMICSS